MDILIIEDELHNLRLLQGMLQQLRPHWKIVQTIDSVSSGIEWLNSNKPDLIFMDVQLIDGICFSIFEKTDVDCPVIFTTAYDNYAIQAFKVNSIDYLLKPIKEKDLEHSINQFEKLYHSTLSHSKTDYSEVLQAIKQGEKKFRSRFLVQGVSAYYKIDVKDISYFYTENKICFAVDKQSKEHIIGFTLESLEEELNPDEFFRANRNTILHIGAVYKFEDYFGGKLHVTLVPPHKTGVIISRLKNMAFKNWIGK